MMLTVLFLSVLYVNLPLYSEDEIKTITVTSPNGGEEWAAGSSQAITWTSTGDIQNVQIHYSIDNGANWIVITDSTPNISGDLSKPRGLSSLKCDKSFEWVVPDTLSDTCLVRVRDVSESPSDVSDCEFRIVAEEQPEITVYSPNGGEEWHVGSTEYIQWLAKGNIENVQIHYSIDNGANWILITDSTPSISESLKKPRGLSGVKCENSYEWELPDTVSDNCLVRVRDVSGTPSDNSDEVFKIIAADEPEIYVYTPNGGEQWSVGSTQYLQWMAKGNIDNVQIHYSIDNGANWILITDSTPSISESLKKPRGLSVVKCENSYEWEVPNTISDKCLVRVRDVSGTPSDTSDSVFEITEAEAPSITVVAPNGGEEWSVDSSYFIQWTTTGDIEYVQIDYSIDNGANWTLITESTPNEDEDLSKSRGLSSLKCEGGKYSWKVPDTISDNCLVRVRDLSGATSDTSDSVFKIVKGEAPSITVVAPNGGEEWIVGSAYFIQWTCTGDIQNVQIHYSIDNGANWIVITESTPNKHGDLSKPRGHSPVKNENKYSWTVPDTISDKCLVRVRDVSGTPSDTSDSTFTIKAAENPPVLDVNRDKLNFAYILGGEIPETECLAVSNHGGGVLKWAVTADAGWITFTPTEGEDYGVIKVNIDPTGLEAGDYTGTITVQNTENPDQTAAITVYLKVKTADEDRAPIGCFDTPLDNATVSGSVPVTGWALDDVRIDAVKLYYEDEDKSLVYIGKATFVEGARPDIVPSFPDYPHNFSAGWGYMLLTNYLPNNGNGTYKIHAKATDSAGHTTTLDIKSIHCDNLNAEKPFGALDTPDQGGTASGKGFVVFGWALTPLPNSIPADGSTIFVWVDGVNLGHPKYNQYRDDIATLFPGFANSMGAVGYYVLDTRKYKDGLHTISWLVRDSAGHTEGIGSRYFSVLNSSSGDPTQQDTDTAKTRADAGVPFNNKSPRIPVDNYNESIEIMTGNGESPIEIQALDYLKLRVVEANSQSRAALLSDLPIGSTFDAANGIFYWQPGPGFKGDFTLNFLVTDQNGNTTPKDITIHILPR
ncbi:MAG: hypothetical protein QG657_193 [Acidobacteriota bacterium]|nr:hypothetical protein [Acidobacteriota bacterium]